MNTIVDVAVANVRFKKTVAAVGTAGLVKTLQGAYLFTVFAPNYLGKLSPEGYSHVY